MPGVFQLLDTLRNKLDCTLWDLRRQLRPSLRTSEIRLRRTVRTDFLLRVPAALVLVICAAAGVRCRGPSQPVVPAAGRGAHAVRVNARSHGISYALAAKPKSHLYRDPATRLCPSSRVAAGRDKDRILASPRVHTKCHENEKLAHKLSTPMITGHSAETIRFQRVREFSDRDLR